MSEEEYHAGSVIVALLPGTPEISQQASHKPGETEACGVKSMVIPAGIMGL